MVGPSPVRMRSNYGILIMDRPFQLFSGSLDITVRRVL